MTADFTANYLKSDRITSNGKFGWRHIYFYTTIREEMSLANQGFKYYIKTPVGTFGENMIVRVLKTFETPSGVLMCECQNTINMIVVAKATDVILNTPIWK